jgi:hypothetical protein
MLEQDIKDLVAAGASADREKARAVFAQLREALSTARCAPPSPIRRARSAGASTLGQAGHPARLRSATWWTRRWTTAAAVHDRTRCR